MQTIVFLLLAFLISLFSILLYLKNKTSRKDKLSRGICPVCLSEPKTFTDKFNNTFKIDVIKSKVLKNHGCSGGVDIEYICTVCGNKEVHTHDSGGCKL